MEGNKFNLLYEKNVKKKLKKKDKLTYLSWASAWAEVKKEFPDATYHIYERETPDGLILNYYTDSKTCWVKVGVTIGGLEHIVNLPCLNFRNQSIKYEDITSMDVNKSIQRALTKGCAMHGLALYIYEGEDLPEPEKERMEEESANLEKARKELIKVMGEVIEKGTDKNKVYNLIAKLDGGNKNPNAIKDLDVCKMCIEQIKEKFIKGE